MRTINEQISSTRRLVLKGMHSTLERYQFLEEVIGMEHNVVSWECIKTNLYKQLAQAIARANIIRIM